MASANDTRHQTQVQKDVADQNFDYMFKLLIIGNSSVGKTSFLFRYADDSFTSAFVSTVGIDFKVKTVYRNEKRVKLQIWDTAGQERYRTITTAYYRGAMGFLLMYDITNQESFYAVQDWATQIKTYSWDNAQVILVGNKCDLEDDRLVSREDGQRLANELGMLQDNKKHQTNSPFCVPHKRCVYKYLYTHTHYQSKVWDQNDF
uniref:small monomeric GTPase n=1 Tax=Cyprinus carpio TaxID=7962 RepID=A0A8C2KR88_CYPCA